MYRRYSGNDRRRFQRLSINLSVFYKVDHPPEVRIMVGEEEIEATTLDLSEGGIAFLTNYNIPVWTRLFIKFVLFKLDKAGAVNVSEPLKIIGEVCSNNLLANNEYRLGISFKEINTTDKKQIANYIGNTLGAQSH